MGHDFLPGLRSGVNMYQRNRAGEKDAGSIWDTIGSGSTSDISAAASFAAAGDVWIPKPPCPAHQKKAG